MATEISYPSDLTAVKKIVVNGSSLTVCLTKELKQMGLDRGDYVEVILHRITPHE